MSEYCPKCKSRNTVLCHDRIKDTWQSKCKACNYYSKPTSNYDSAWAWFPEVAQNKEV